MHAACPSQLLLWKCGDCGRWHRRANPDAGRRRWRLDDLGVLAGTVRMRQRLAQVPMTSVGVRRNAPVRLPASLHFFAILCALATMIATGAAFHLTERYYTAFVEGGRRLLLWAAMMGLVPRLRRHLPLRLENDAGRRERCGGICIGGIALSFDDARSVVATVINDGSRPRRDRRHMPCVGDRPHAQSKTI